MNSKTTPQELSCNSRMTVHHMLKEDLFEGNPLTALNYIENKVEEIEKIVLKKLL